jgi:phasin family protein
MYANAEQFAAAGKAGFEAFYNAASTGLAGLEKLVELNVSSAKSIIADVEQSARAALAAKDAREFLELNASAAQPAIEKSLAYSKEVYGILTSTQAALRAAAEEQSAAAQKEFGAILEKALKTAPPGTESAVAALRQAVAAATSAYDNAARIAKQSFETAEANFSNVASTAAANVKAATKQAAKRR